MSDDSRLPATLSAIEFEELFDKCKNWGKWGTDDERGALNYIEADDLRKAATLVRTGQVISCAWDLDTQVGPDNPRPVTHYMSQLHDIDLGDSGDLRFLMDYVGMEMHGDAHSHIDALCHVVFRGLLYNGVPADSVVRSTGVGVQDMAVAAQGIVTRGILIDVPKLRGVEWLEPGESVLASDIETAETAGIRLRRGDIVLVRTGHARRRRVLGPWNAAEHKAGVHPRVMPLLHDREIAGIGWDSDGETMPAPCEGVSFPVHAIGINAMGLYFMDCLDLEELAEACAREIRTDFLFVVAPLRLVHGTGSPVNPLAIL